MIFLTKSITNLDGTPVQWESPQVADKTMRTIRDTILIGYYTNVVFLRGHGIVAIVNERRNHAIVLLPNGETIQSPISIQDDKSFMLN